MENNEPAKSTTGIQPNLAALLSYSLGWITGLIFFLVEKENKYVRFHAFQSIVTFLAFTVLSILLTVIPVIGWMLLPVLYIAELIVWILLMVKAYRGEKFKLPVAGDMAEKNA